MFTPYASYRLYTGAGLGAALDTQSAVAVWSVLDNNSSTLTGSFKITPENPTGVFNPGYDPEADFWSAKVKPLGEGDVSVSKQLEALAAGWKVYVDTSASPLVYVICRNKQACTLFDSLTNYKLLPSRQMVVADATEKKGGVKGSAIVGGLLAAGAGALVAGPAGAIVGGLAVGYLIQTTDYSKSA